MITDSFGAKFRVSIRLDEQIIVNHAVVERALKMARRGLKPQGTATALNGALTVIAVQDWKK